MRAPRRGHPRRARDTAFLLSSSPRLALSVFQSPASRFSLLYFPFFFRDRPFPVCPRRRLIPLPAPRPSSLHATVTMLLAPCFGVCLWARGWDTGRAHASTWRRSGGEEGEGFFRCYIIIHVRCFPVGEVLRVYSTPKRLMCNILRF
jgi:hypothetical protein